MTIKQFSQTDPQWKSTLLGFDKSSTIGGFGCLLTSMNMCAAHYGAADLTPATLNDKMKAIGGFQAGTAFIIARMIGQVVPGMSVDYRACGGASAPLAEIDANIAQGLPAIIEVDWSPQPGVQTHYMVVYAKDGSDYLVYDPYPFPVANGQIKLTASKYAQVAGTKDPARIITGVFFTRGPAQVTPPTPPQLDKGIYASFSVFASADDLALRSQPVIADYTLLKRYPANTEFKILEADAAAGPKVGKQDTWLPIKAPDGAQGYVAAWLVSKTKTSAAPVPNMPPPAPAPLPKDAPVVKTNVDGLKLRSKPDNTDATILKMYPIGTELKCLESGVDVKRKVGTNFEWLNVSDVEGKQGVVAAWYVSIVSLGAFGPEAQRQTGGPSFSIDEIPPLVLRTTEDSVAMRSKPFISKNTLIQRLPKGAELIPLGKQDTAAQKVGKSGKWIRVQDVKGNKGHVAAWLLKERPQNPPPQASPKDS